MQITQLIKFAPLAFLLVACIACGYYRHSANNWRGQYDDEHDRLTALQQTNSDLAAANTALTDRNNILVETLDARTDELKSKQTELATARRNYRTALDTDTDWSRTVVPAAVAGSLHSSADDDIQSGTSTGNRGTE